MAKRTKLHPRAARTKVLQARDCLAYLEFARRAKLELDGNCDAIDGGITELTNVVYALSEQAGERIQPRNKVRVTHRTEHSPPRHQYLIFLDECGTHSLDIRDDPFPVFCLCAVIVDREKYGTFDRQWKAWKSRWLGSWQIRVHEPDIRKRSREFHGADKAYERSIIDALSSELSTLGFICIAAVIDKRALTATYPSGRVDDFLPSSTYLMCVDFVFERAVHFLYEVGEDAEGVVIAESRGLREDAEVHSEFLRLQLVGTQYIADGYFRNQLRPYIEFKRKDTNESGLQIADIVARPIAEKVLEPANTPERWQVVAPKIYDGKQDRRSSYGLKVFPSSDIGSFFGESAFKAKEDTLRVSSSTDPQVRVHNGNDTE